MMRFDTGGSPHIRGDNRVSRMMLKVLLALLPAVAVHVWLFGWGIVVQLLLASGAALGMEAAMLHLRRRPVRPFLADLSAVVTAWLLVLSLPPLLPWWATLTGVFFAIVMAKHLYGGLGYNPFNPAMIGFVVLLVAFPREVTGWLLPVGLDGWQPGLTDAARAIFTGRLPAGLSWDAISQATPLDLLRQGVQNHWTMAEIQASPAFGVLAGEGWQWLSLAYALGGLWLLQQRVADWRVPAGVFTAVVALSGPAWLFWPETNPTPIQHLFHGGLMLGAFFIATDPVSGSTTPRGRFLFGLGVGLLVLLIRRWGAYPDGVAFAVLLMNLAVPWIDRYTRPRVFGHGGTA